MLNPRIFLPAFVTLLALATGAFGDTVILKNGDKVEGKILRESETEVVVETSVSASVKDEQVIKRADVKEIKKVLPDVEAWAGLKGLALTDETLSAAEYTSAIDRLNNFVTAFPKSAYLAEAQKKLTAFQEEKKRVDGGELKLNGQWLAKEVVEVERVQLDGKSDLRTMQRQAKAGQLTDALNTFDTMEKRASGSASFPDAVLLARQCIAALKPAVENQKVAVKARLDENKRRLGNVTGNDKIQLENAQKQEAARNEADLTRAERSGVKWIPLAVANERVLNTLGSKLNSEGSSLNRYNVDKMKESIALFEKVKTALAAEDFTAAEEAYKKGTAAWALNDYVKRLQEDVTMGKTKLAAKLAAEKAAAAATKDADSKKPKTAKTSSTDTTEAATAAPEEAAPKEKSVATNPVFWLILLGVVGLAAVGMKAMKREKPPTVTFMDHQ